MTLNNKWQVQGEMTKEQFEMEMRRRLASLQEMIRGDGWRFMMDALAQREDEQIGRASCRERG